MHRISSTPSAHRLSSVVRLASRWLLAMQVPARGPRRCASGVSPGPRARLADAHTQGHNYKQRPNATPQVRSLRSAYSHTVDWSRFSNGVLWQRPNARGTPFPTKGWHSNCDHVCFVDSELDVTECNDDDLVSSSIIHLSFYN